MTGSSAKQSRAAPAIRRSASASIQSVFVDDAAAGRVDQIGVGLHQRELTAADQAAGLLGERAVDRDEVGLGQQLVEPDQPHARLLGRPGVEVRIKRQRRLHAEPAEQAHGGPADPSQADRAKRPVAQLAAHVLRSLVPAAGAHQADP